MGTHYNLSQESQGAYVERRFSDLLNIRQSYDSVWKDLADHFLPTRYRNVGSSPDAWRTMPLLNDKLVDATGILAMRTLASGLQGGITSPARPWFKLGLSNEDLAKYAPVKDWLDVVGKRMANIFNNSNFYNAVHTLYNELGTFGTAFMLEIADFDHGFRFLTFCSGEYCLDCNASQKVDVVFRRVRMSTRQLIERFGVDKLPAYVLNGRSVSGHVGRDQSYNVIHAIYPRKDYKLGKASPIHMPFASVYILEAQSIGQKSSYSDGHVLSVSGFEEFPGFGVRWDVTGNDVYGRSPAMDVLPDCRMLQQMGTSLLKAIHKSVEPPTSVAASLKSEGLDLTPGGVNYVEAQPGQAPQAATPILQIRPEIEAARGAIGDVQSQIQRGLYNDLFRLLLNSDRRQITAKEVAVREEEKLILLGPALERLNSELFDPLIKRTFNLMLRHDLVPPVPQELLQSEESGELKVDFISLLAQAQKLVSTGAVDRCMAFIGSAAQMKPEALDAINIDVAIDEYADYLGVSAGLLNSQEERDLIREQRAQAEMQAEQQAMQQAQMQQTVQNIGGATDSILKLAQIPL